MKTKSAFPLEQPSDSSALLVYCEKCNMEEAACKEDK